MKTKTMRKAMISSILALVLCFAMLIGTTYAWFTDSVASSGNIIKSGTLDIDLLVKGGNTGYTEYTSVKVDQKPIFDYDLWEPGYTLVANAKVTTTGNLALKYTMKLVGATELDQGETDLASVIDVYYAPSEVDVTGRDLTGLTKLGTLDQVLAGTIVINDTLIPGENDTDYATLALKMQESAGNEYQDLTVRGTFDLQILATQYTYEEDSFDDQYDADAEFPEVPAVTVATAIVEGGAASFVADTAPAAGTTAVEITSLDGVEDNDQLVLNVQTQSLDEVTEAADFNVTEGSTAVAGIDLSLVDMDNVAVTFEGGTATVTTFIVPGLDAANITVKYNGEGEQPTFVSYDAATGELVFTTTHFSEFFVEYAGSFSYSPLTDKAYVGDDALFDAMYAYAQSKVTGLEKIDIQAFMNFMEEEWVGCESEGAAYAQLLLNGCQGIRPTYLDGQEEYATEGTTEEEVLAIRQQYFDAYKYFVDTVKFYPVGEGVYGWAPWPVGLSLGDF